MKVKIVNLSQWPLPQYATALSAGLDLRANLTSEVVLRPLARTVVPTGLYLEIPAGYEAQVRPRSGLAAKKGVTVLNAPGTIDADSRGEVGVILVNLSDEPFTSSPARGWRRWFSRVTSRSSGSRWRASKSQNAEPAASEAQE